MSTQISDKFSAWQAECEARFQQLKANEEELNRIFIGIYGLQDELTPEVADKDVTVHRIFRTKDDVPESMKGSAYVRTLRDEIVSLLSYAVGCMFGRYSLDAEGLAYAGGEWDASRYKTFLPDADNCIPVTDEEYFPDDVVGRLVEFARVVYGADTLEENLDFKHDLRGVPGFYTDLVSGEWCLAGQAGILVPFCTAAGYIQGLQIRLDNKSKRKYRWLSSNPKHQHKDGTQKYPNGTAARTWVHITGDHCSSTAHITEGAVKGDVSSFLDGNSLYICVPGVSSINHLLPAIRSLPNIERVESLFDMDQIEDEKYSKALLHMIKMLKSLGIPVEQRQWNPDYNGVDEYKAYCRAARLAA